MEFGIRLTYGSNRTLVKLMADPYDYIDDYEIDLLGEAYQIESPVPEPPLPPPNPSPPPVVTPPTPFEPPSPTTPPFDHLDLPRLPTQPSTIINLTVPRTVVKLGGDLGILDISDAFVSGEWNQPISGEARGEIILADVLVGTTRILDQVAKYRVGDPVSWELEFGYDSSRFVCNAYLVNKPQITFDSESRTIKLQIGCKLHLLSRRQWLRETPYCGKKPKNVEQAVRIYEAFIQENILSLPGHKIIEPPENFAIESAYDFLQTLYAPTDRDVRCNLAGTIQVFERPDYQPGKIPPCVIVSQAEVDDTTLFNTVKLSNTFRQIDKLELRTETYTELSPNYDVSNTRPWYLNGSWRKVTKVTFLGDTEVSRREELYARFPDAIAYSAPSPTTSPTILATTEATVDGTCEKGSLTYATTERLISVTESALVLEKHPSGSRLVKEKTERTFGWATFKPSRTTSSSDRIFINGLTSSARERFTNTAIPSDQACRRDWIRVTTLRDYSRYEIREEFGWAITLVEREVDAYRDATSTRPLDPGLSRTVPRKWVSAQLRGALTDGYWVEQPTRRGSETPPEAQWVRPTVTEITVSGLYRDDKIESEIGYRPTADGDAPMCFKPIQCRNLARRQVRDSYALANSVEVLTQYWRNVKLGDSIDLPDIGFTGQVYAITFRQGGNQCEQLLTLGRIVP